MANQPDQQGDHQGEEQDQPKVFQFSEEEMEALLKDKEMIEAGGEVKKKKRKKGASRRTEEASPGIPTAVVDVLRKKADERDLFLERLQRVQAEYVNYQKRSKREKSELGDRSVREFLTELLPLLDDFEGAARTMEKAESTSVAKGVEILRDRLWKILSDRGVTEIETEGKTFDPKVHEAVAQELSPDAVEGEILEVYQRGYAFKEWVIRASRVKIARRGEAPPPDESPLDEEPPSEEGSVPDDAPPAPEAPSTSVEGNPLLDEPEEQPHA
ncbi:MAG: nucleotide exchange factor GrpE [Planctomycetota bacterium]|nr:nucleotide exchange factor GrpE [Planctomycetota bacterium]